MILLVCNDPFDVLSFGGNVKCMLMFELTAHVKSKERDLRGLVINGSQRIVCW